MRYENHTIIYDYKDGYRIYWRIGLDPGEHVPWSDDPEDQPDTMWTYTIYRSDSGCEGTYKEFYRDEVWGQYDIPPTVADVMQNFLGRMNSLAIYFSIDGKEIT